MVLLWVAGSKARIKTRVYLAKSSKLEFFKKARIVQTLFDTRVARQSVPSSHARFRDTSRYIWDRERKFDSNSSMQGIDIDIVISYKVFWFYHLAKLVQKVRDHRLYPMLSLLSSPHAHPVSRRPAKSAGGRVTLDAEFQIFSCQCGTILKDDNIKSQA